MCAFTLHRPTHDLHRVWVLGRSLSQVNNQKNSISFSQRTLTVPRLVFIVRTTSFKNGRSSLLSLPWVLCFWKIPRQVPGYYLTYTLQFTWARSDLERQYSKKADHDMIMSFLLNLCETCKTTLWGYAMGILLAIQTFVCWCHEPIYGSER